MLHTLGLDGLNVQRYNRLYEEWVGFDTGHSIRLEDRDRRILLIKAIHVEDCLDLGRHLQKLMSPNSPNLMQGLTRERKFICTASRTSSNHDIASPFLPNEPYDSNHEFLFHMTSPPGPQPDIPQARVPSIHNITSQSSGASNSKTRLPTIHNNNKNSMAHPIQKHTRRPSSNSDAISLTESNISVKNEPSRPSNSDAPMSAHQRKGKQRAKPMKSKSPEPSSGSEIASLDSASELEQPQSVNVPAKRRHRLLRHHPSTMTTSHESSTRQPLVKRESTGSLLSHGGSKDKPIEVKTVLTWPVDFYACDIAEGFKVCHTAANTHKSVATAFKTFFGIPFVSSTFYDNRKIWDYDGNRKLREQCICHGRTEQGSWVTFMSEAKQPGRK